MAKANSAARSLIEISKVQGWDSTKIWDQAKGAYGESILSWDHPREPFARNLGEVPGGLPAHDQAQDTSGGPTMTEQITFNHPDVSRESRVSGKPKLTLANPVEEKMVE